MPVQSTAMGPHAICTVRQPMDTRFSTTDGRSISPLLPLAPAAANTESTTRVENKCVMCWSNTTKSAAPCTPAITDTKFCRTTSSLAMRSRAQPSDLNPGKFSRRLLRLGLVFQHGVCGHLKETQGPHAVVEEIAQGTKSRARTAGRLST